MPVFVVIGSHIGMFCEHVRAVGCDGRSEPLAKPLDCGGAETSRHGKNEAVGRIAGLVLFDGGLKILCRGCPGRQVSRLKGHQIGAICVPALSGQVRKAIANSAFCISAFKRKMKMRGHF